ncbi:protein transport protein Sec16B isoform X3 [Lepus europaeus]|uniref:protein transport protein Sec16B isoform X3 n=1 Tax=Lepus europaeus TaxID=9983 RepID=UPI002B466C4A|nr:protein transport protein Sec16B isoform X3 [Lepus europaeus]
MEPWVPQWPPPSRGRPRSPAQDSERGLQRDGYHRPAPHSRHNGEGLPQWQDVQGSPQPQQDPRAGPQRPQHVPRLGAWQQRAPAVDYYEGGHRAQLYSRPSYESLYPALTEDYAYGSHYYHGHPQWLQEGRVPRQGSPYLWRENYRDQKHLSEHRPENQSRTFRRNSETQFQRSNRQNPHKDGPASSSGQERPGELFAEGRLSWGPTSQPSLGSKSNLLQLREAGLSSSSYELSQYMADAPELYDPAAAAGWRPVPAEDIPVAGPKAPKKFYVPHVSVSFGPGGQLVCVSPSSPMDGQTALVEVHSMEVILNDSEEQEEMRSFPGPLIREDVHKIDVMTFCQQKAAQSRKSGTPGGRDLALLWQLLVLLCRQNGSMAGSDIAELLLQDCKKLEKYKRQPPVGNLINLADEDWPVLSSGPQNLLTGETPPSVETPAQIVEKFTKLLYYGRKKEALEWAMKNHLWGHALFLSSKMEPRTYNWVMSGFTSTLALNDPLQTLFQLLSGRIPQAATCCGDTQWGDWRPHLAVILSNQAGDPELRRRVIVSMGDTLAGKGLVEAAHFCYLMAQVPFGHYTVNTDRLALLGSSHSQEFSRFASAEAVQRTEVLEYCQTLGGRPGLIASFQVYKLLYASRLADYGLASQAFHYCEAIGTAVLSQAESSHPVLLVELIKLAERLKLVDPLVLERHGGGEAWEPDWLQRLRRRHQEMQQKAAGDAGEPRSANLDIPGATGTTERTSYQDLPGSQSYSDAPGCEPAPWPTPEQTGLPQPFALQPGPTAGQAGAPVPLYSVPETHFPASTEEPQAVGGQVWEDTWQTHSAPGENTASPETFQQPEGLEVISTPQEPLSPRAQSFSESCPGSVKEADEESSEEADGKSARTPAHTGKPADAKGSAKRSGFGWFSWFRSKPTENAPHSGDEDSSDSPDSESVSSELYSNPSVLLPPPSVKGAVPLYNPSQVPQLPTAAGLSRPNRLAQRRYPTQPC